MEKTKLIRIALIIVISIFLSGNIFLSWRYFAVNRQLKIADAKIDKQIKNDKVLIFANLFVDKVLLGQETVSFEDRLKLENAVRDINNEIIFAQWQKFVDSKSDQETQQSVGELFKAILDKLKY